MSLREMMDRHRELILRLTRETIRRRSAPQVTEREIDGGLPRFYEQVMANLTSAEQADLDLLPPPPALVPPSNTELAQVAGDYGKELRRLGFTAAQVVHIYGALCDALTRAAKQLRISIDATEFNLLHRCLDDAIGEAVTEYEVDRDKSIAKQQNKYLGFSMHELRNALSNAVFAAQLIKKGAVGPGGKTGEALDRNLARMRDLIDRSLAEVRLRSDVQPRRERLTIGQILEEIEVTSAAGGDSRGVLLEVEYESGLAIDADRQMMISAVANLVQNALKFTHAGGTVAVRASSSWSGMAIIEVEDACGGLPPGLSEQLANPTPFRTTDLRGTGLGLSIVHRAVRLHDGQVTVRNLPGRGCVFSIALPLARGEAPSQ